MKEFAALILLIVLIVVGWNQPYKAHFGSVFGNPPPVVVTPAPAATAPVPPAPAAAGATPARDNSWLRKRSTLDLPEGRTGEGKNGR